MTEEEEKKEWTTLGSKVTVETGEAIKTIADAMNANPSHLISELLDPVIYFFRLGQDSIWGMLEVPCSCGEVFVVDATDPQIQLTLQKAFSGWHNCSSGKDL